MSEQPQGGQEQRMTFRLLSYWQRVRGDKSFPSLADIAITDIEEMYHQTFVISLGDHEDEHMFEYFGPELASKFGDDYTGQYVIDSMNDASVYNTIGFYDRVLEARGPVSESSEFFLEGNEVRYRTLLLPLSSDDISIDYIIGTTNYKVFV
ncbi:MAG: PAS domain-containing protein [Rickettsiales bacterium]|nr:PAS domain-containing protein [Rickettsiales bacterium]